MLKDTYIVCILPEKFYPLIIACLISCLFFTGLHSENVHRIYIALDGKDANKGTKDQPLATFEAAQNAVRKAKGTGLYTKIEVLVRKGVYFLEQTVEFTSDDSGTDSCNIVWRAADGEKVILSGGKKISGRWRSHDNGIWSISIKDTKGWKNNLLLSESYQKRPFSPWNFRELFVNGNRAIRARFPNKDTPNPFMYVLSGDKDQLRIVATGMKISWGEEEDAQINLVPRWRFFNQWNDITGVDVENGIIKIGPRERHGEIDKGSWFWIEGVKEELDAKGEWYLDHREGRLYYKPLDGESPDRTEFIAPYLNRIFYLKGDIEKGTYVKNLFFKGFEFMHSTYTLGQIEARVHTDGAVVFENTIGCSISDCHFENIGGYALWLHLDSRNNLFDNNTVINSGGGGVLMTGSRLSYMDDTKVYTLGEKAAKVFPILNSITRNRVEHCGKIRYYGGGVHIDSRPPLMAMEPGNYIAHNHFNDLSRNGIFAFRNQGGNIIEYNEIHDCMQTTIDGAAIHLATMNRLAAPNHILNNYLYDIWGYEQLPNGKPRRTLANGIFLDWATSNTTLKNNVIFNSGEKEIKPIMGNWNLVMENNLTSKTKIPALEPEELGPLGKGTNGLVLKDQRTVGVVVTSDNSDLTSYIGNWQDKLIAGMRNLFYYTCKQAAVEQSAKVVYRLPVAESGNYKVCLMYFPDEKAASNATITIHGASIQKQMKWNFKRGDVLGFAVSVGEFYFQKGEDVSVSISNEGADGSIIADGVGIMKVK